MRHIKPILLDASARSDKALGFEEYLRDRVVGQERAVRTVSRAYQVFLAGLQAPDRPLINLLLLGPTGSGKTRLVEVAAEWLLADPKKLIKINCGEYQHDHEIARLVGAPPGYIGHRETKAILNKALIDSMVGEAPHMMVLLFDEIEKAAPAVFNILLGILDKAELGLGDGSTVSLARAMIFMTSNLGSHEVARLVEGGIGFAAESAAADDLDQRIYRTALEATKRKFSPEFVNRLDRVVVFRTLHREHLDEILTIELSKVQDRILMAMGHAVFPFVVERAARDFLLEEGTNAKFGARPLKRTVERFVTLPISNLLVTGQVDANHLLIIDRANGKRELAFYRVPMERVPEAKAA